MWEQYADVGLSLHNLGNNKTDNRYNRWVNDILQLDDILDKQNLICLDFLLRKILVRHLFPQKIFFIYFVVKNVLYLGIYRDCKISVSIDNKFWIDSKNWTKFIYRIIWQNISQHLGTLITAWYKYVTIYQIVVLDASKFKHMNSVYCKLRKCGFY